MGVMSCCRNSCEEIMCHTYSSITGYICSDCKHELEQTNPQSIKDVEKFMDSPKSDNSYYDDNGEFSLSKMFGEE